MTTLRSGSTVLLLWNRGFRIAGFSFEGFSFTRGYRCWRFGPFFYVGGAR